MSIRNAVMLTALAAGSVSAMAETDLEATNTLTVPGMATTDGILTYCRRVHRSQPRNTRWESTASRKAIHWMRSKTSGLASSTTTIPRGHQHATP